MMIEANVLEMLGDNLLPYGLQKFEMLPRSGDLILIGEAGADAWFFVRQVIHTAESYSPKMKINLFCERAEAIDGVLLDEK